MISVFRLAPWSTARFAVLLGALPVLVFCARLFQPACEPCIPDVPCPPCYSWQEVASGIGACAVALYLALMIVCRAFCQLGTTRRG